MKFIIVQEKSLEDFQNTVQDFLNVGYELRGDVFITYSPEFHTYAPYFNQVLIENDTNTTMNSEDHT